MYLLSSYKTHAIAGILFALPFVPSVFYLFFALLGASIPDMDHHNNNNKVLSMFLVGILLSVLLFFLDGVSLSGLIIISLAIVFYLSKHRGFTHTLIGVIVLSFLFMLMVMGFIPVFYRLSLLLNISIPSNIVFFIVLSLIGYFIVSRRFLLVYILFLAVYLLVIPVDYSMIQWNMVFLILLVGALSHITLDLWTPAGLAVFKPISNVKFHRKLAVLFVGIWIVLSFVVLWKYGSFLTHFTSIFTYT